MKPGLSTFLDLSRWFAALLVVVNHARALVLADFAAAASAPGGAGAHGPMLRALYFFTGLGHEAVVIFFVISGFLVGGSTLQRWQQRGPDMRAYVSARASRIYTTLIPALIAGIALDSIGLRWFNASGIYTTLPEPPIATITYVIASTMNLPTFLGNLFMMQGVLTQTLGSNGPLWSLACEWWYYCVFALGAYALTSAKGRRIGWATAACALVVLFPLSVMLWGIVWLIGVLTFRWVNSGAWRPHPLVGFALFALALAASRMTHGIGAIETNLFAAFARDFVLSIAYAAALASASRLAQALPLAAWHHQLAEFSYTTYLFHFPALLLICAAAAQSFGLHFTQRPDARGMALFAAAVVLVYAYCYAVSLLTERHTPRARHALDTLLRARPALQVEPSRSPASEA
ncbi:peptidoglycan/LPS O-acetylase OafA/YrhL [Paraburkholderia bannensis]|uniref:Peptidoglycan/LPS O-acetylase OafA/YrhL n=1 Tax=Paraburkholderia bannensis TaxID=765414 RepID=A0A7W9WWG6_9BURK|nr:MULTISPECIES: acyltransferase family protein [Paraburkholderia]MBB3260936.1 peptidoglycan/LPS O-acetylase OafA/YrhL [Paraburkholderia sp. WP4_3_2]MBB6105973.1 peptidoglycan/LPS O-acetylase OafA/YrhL [Paraburkholderia bannensis]